MTIIYWNGRDSGSTPGGTQFFFCLLLFSPRYFFLFLDSLLFKLILCLYCSSCWRYLSRTARLYLAFRVIFLLQARCRMHTLPMYIGKGLSWRFWLILYLSSVRFDSICVLGLIYRRVLLIDYVTRFLHAALMLPLYKMYFFWEKQGSPLFRIRLLRNIKLDPCVSILIYKIEFEKSEDS